MENLDSQQVEIVGRHIVIANLIAAGIEVAQPIRDRGIDLIAYGDGKGGGEFQACPIQIKASTNEGFNLDKKYERFHNLRIVYVWKARVPADSEIYALTYAQAQAVIQGMGYDITQSWDRENGRYAVTKPSLKLKKILQGHQIKTPNDWFDKLGFANFRSNLPSS